MRSLLVAAALALSTNALSQAVSPALEVQRLAPQLIAFAGGEANFQNLVNGLASGTAVTLTTVLPAGGTQVVTFTPASKLTPLQIAQTLESVRQSLISRGIATPTAQQLATALVGGSLSTALGPTLVNGVITTTTPLGTNTLAQQSPAISLQNQNRVGAAAGGSAAGRSSTSDSAFPRGISDTPPTAVPGVTAGATAGATGAPATTPGTPTTGPASVRTQ
jgi:hypothetical protein